MTLPWITMLAWISLGVGDAGLGEATECRYQFQVWQPNKDQEQRLGNIEVQFANFTNYVDRELARYQVRRVLDVSEFRNWSRAFERSLNEIKTDHLQKYSELQDLRFKLSLFELRLKDLRGTFDSFIYKMPQIADGRSEGRKHFRRDRVHTDAQADNPRHHRVENLKMLVSDLKVEWILLKRDFINIKKDNSGMRKEQDRIKNSSTAMQQKQDHLTDSLANLQSVSFRTTNDLSDLKSAIRNLNEGLAGLQRAQEKLAGDLLNQESGLASLQASTLDMRRGIADLQTSYEHLETFPTANEIRLEEQNRPDSRINMKPLKSVNGKNDYPKDCQDILSRGYRTSGGYRVKPGPDLSWIDVFCDIEGDLAYTVVQRRVDGLQNFNRGWLEYKYGFGNVYGEFWLGNEPLHAMTSSARYILRIDILDWEGNRTYAEYDRFRVAAEHDRYELHVSGYYGNAGDSLSYHDGMKFSTSDLDNDVHTRNCAAENKGGWWYNGCYSSNLNGVYHVGWYAQAKYTFADGVIWYTLKNSDRYSLRKVEMKLRRHT